MARDESLLIYRELKCADLETEFGVAYEPSTGTMTIKLLNDEKVMSFVDLFKFPIKHMFQYMLLDMRDEINEGRDLKC